MKQKFWFISAILFSALILSGLFSFRKGSLDDDQMVVYKATPAEIRMFWNDDTGKPLSSLQNLKMHTQKHRQQLLFAMNGGMYQEDQSPLGLYIENGQQLHKINMRNGYGNFYLEPNGIFYTTKDNRAVVCKRSAFKASNNVFFATQSGPMLVVDGKINSQFTKGSANLNVRNGVGVLPDGKVVLAMSKGMVNLYDFAEYFQNLGCRNALFLDGFVCRTYYPAKQWTQLDGQFGVMIGIVK